MELSLDWRSIISWSSSTCIVDFVAVSRSMATFSGNFAEFCSFSRSGLVIGVDVGSGSNSGLGFSGGDIWIYCGVGFMSEYPNFRSEISPINGYTIERGDFNGVAIDEAVGGPEKGIKGSNFGL